jgi:hypothetical protein
MAKYRTMQGKEIDMEKLARQNELMPAIGNMKVNARGDELGPGGKIIRKREEIIAEYYENNPKARATRSVKPAAETPNLESSNTSAEPISKSKKTHAEEE